MNGIAVTDENGNKLGHSKVSQNTFTFLNAQNVFRNSCVSDSLFIAPKESCSKRHHAGGHLPYHYGCTRNEYAWTFNFTNNMLNPSCYSLHLLTFLVPPTPLSYHAYHHAEAGKVQVHAGQMFNLQYHPPSLHLPLSVKIKGFSSFSQRITYLHGPIQIMMVGVL